MTLKKLHFRDPGKLICIRSDFNGISVALVHHNPADIFSKNLRKKCEYILLISVHGLFPVSENRHLAFEKFLDDQILNHGIILHLIHDQMADTAVLLLCFQPVLQIQDRIHILIAKLSFFVLYLRKRRKSFLSQETVVQNIKVSRLVHPVKTALHCLPFFLRKVKSLQRFHLINEILRHCIHSGKQRDIHKFKVKKLDDLLFFFDYTTMFHIPEIHKAVFQFYQIAFHAVQEIPGLFFFQKFLIAQSCDLTLDQIVTVFTV